MPQRDTAVGHRLDTITAHCDARWLMAYAAGVPDERAELYETVTDLCVHPLFAVAPEWQLLAGDRSLPQGMTPEEAKQGIHIGHDLVLAGRVRPERASPCGSFSHGRSDLHVGGPFAPGRSSAS